MKAVWIFLFALVLMAFSARQPNPGEALAQKSGCFTCHGGGDNVIGPSFQDIAERHKENPEMRPSLVKAVKFGSKGNWTEVSRGMPMPPYSGRLTDTEIDQLVDWILSL